MVLGAYKSSIVPFDLLSQKKFVYREVISSPQKDSSYLKVLFT